MRATGIVRRMDDLGRVVIPKEIRRMMGIREGDPLEIFTTEEAVCFRKYRPIGEHSWDKAKAITKRILPEPFALFDRYEECKAFTSSAMSEQFSTLGDKYRISQIWVEGETEGYLVTTPNCENVNLAVKVLGELLSND